MVDLSYWASEVLREARLQFDIEGQTVSSGLTASGVTPVMSLSGGGYWQAVLSNIFLLDPDHVRVWRALAAHLDGGVRPVILLLRDDQQAPWPLVSSEQIMSYPRVLHAGDVAFDGGIGYYYSVIDSVNEGAVALGATAMTIRMDFGGILKGGEHFSVDHPEFRWRLYRIESAVAIDSDTYNVKFRPPLRVAMPDATKLEFDKPRCVMRLTSPADMKATFEAPYMSKPSITFIEAFPPFPT